MSNWTLVKIVDRQVDGAGRHRVRVLVTDGQEQRCESLKFSVPPSDLVVQSAIAQLLDLLNATPEPPLENQVETLKQEIVALKAENEKLKKDKAP